MFRGRGDTGPDRDAIDQRMDAESQEKAKPTESVSAARQFFRSGLMLVIVIMIMVAAEMVGEQGIDLIQGPDCHGTNLRLGVAKRLQKPIDNTFDIAKGIPKIPNIDEAAM